MKALLYYVHDPMCSWCWAFAPAYRTLHQCLAQDIGIRELLGGLAPDTDQPMPESMQQQLQQTWALIEQRVPGTRFNYDFWKNCRPWRSTYPACRAVIAARQQGQEYAALMTQAIQQAYYTAARNPSEIPVLIELAHEIGLDDETFSHALHAEATQRALMADITLSRQMNVESFPSLVLECDGTRWRIPVDYTDAATMLGLIRSLTTNADGEQDAV